MGSYRQLRDARLITMGMRDTQMPEKPYYEDAYIYFPTGRLTLMQAQQIFSTIPFELDLIDHTEHFTWYSDRPNREHVRRVDQLEETVEQCHPAMIVPGVKAIIRSFREGRRDMVERAVVMKGHKTLVQYYALRDPNGEYLGTIEFTGNVDHIIDLYDQGAYSADITSGASTKADKALGRQFQQQDATSGASAQMTPPKMTRWFKFKMVVAHLIKRNDHK
ncbi:NADPH-dependent FMN reductase [Secundilactobacillus odoratitofui DSM 19909 = JCM 15043]|uniref:NADPH-dependent FMN reductase n=2 Tax=Secundilactobacillus odoratitofui TaxID=480930 RepID=A0A0R1LPY1_9LACO|nr:NADPH-dependent FMN reductase [Secundilactobacillus odoratitofui DSM 19909 = JCM 15043]